MQCVRSGGQEDGRLENNNILKHACVPAPCAVHFTSEFTALDAENITLSSTSTEPF